MKTAMELTLATPQLDEPASALENTLNRLFRSRGSSDQDLVQRQSEDELRAARQRAAEIIKRSHLPDRALAFTRTNFTLPEPVAPLLPRLGSGVLAAILGARGTGKTCAVTGLARAAAKTGRTVRYAKAMEIFLNVRESYRDDSTLSEARAIAAFLLPQVLIIDEIQERGETKWEDRLMTFLIDMRYDAMKDTILIANLLESELAGHVGPSITDRLIETGGVVVFGGTSHRGVAGDSSDRRNVPDHA